MGVDVECLHIEGVCAYKFSLCNTVHATAQHFFNLEAARKIYVK